MAMTDRRAQSRRRRRAWLWVILWSVVVLWAGGESASAAATSRFLGPLLHWLLPDPAPETLARVHWLIRKGAHVVEYGVLALLTLAALRASVRVQRAALAAGALTWVALVASFDEARQAATPTRTGSLGDVALDVAGGVLALTVAIVYTRVMRAGPPAPERE
jgi:VanZ family protein